MAVYKFLTISGTCTSLCDTRSDIVDI